MVEGLLIVQPERLADCVRRRRRLGETEIIVTEQFEKIPGIDVATGSVGG